MDSAATNVQKRTEFVKKIFDLVANIQMDKATRLASQIFSLPVSGVTFVTDDKVYFKSLQGLELKETDRQSSFSNRLMNSEEVLVIEDTLKDETFKTNPLVTEGPRIRFYSGVPIIAEGYVLGEFFIAGQHPRQFSDFEKSVLKNLSLWIEEEIMFAIKLSDITMEQRKYQDELSKTNRELQEGKARDDAMLQSIGDGVIGINDSGEVVFTNKPVEFMTGWNQEELSGKPLWYSKQNGRFIL